MSAECYRSRWGRFNFVGVETADALFWMSAMKGWSHIVTTTHEGSAKIMSAPRPIEGLL